VKTLITGAGRPTTAIDYRMENQPNGWRAYDVLVDGVSLMSSYRETFLGRVRHSGIDGLIKTLNGADRAHFARQGSDDRLCAWTA
jgi:phospholipid transport system substrate-binding protein